MNNIKISIIIPIFNSEEYLERCINSVIYQTFNNLEIILINDGSTDSSQEICDLFAKKDKRIKVIYQENKGVSKARNTGIEYATGDYIAFVDSDDVIDKDYIETLSKYDSDWIVSGSCCCGEYKKSDIISNENILGSPGPCEKLYKKNLVKKIRFNPKINIGEDIIFNLEFLSICNNITAIEYKGYRVNHNPNSLTRKYMGKYTYMLDEEYQKWWGETMTSARNKAGLPLKSGNHNDSCSVWVFQKIQNLCYPDCPHGLSEKLARIKNQLDGCRQNIKLAKNPVSIKTHLIIKLCLALKHPLFVYLLFKLINCMYNKKS